jgi:hypothetical protein
MLELFLHQSVTERNGYFAFAEVCMDIEMCTRCEDSAKRNPSTHLPTDHGETTFCGLSELGGLRWSNERERKCEDSAKRNPSTLPHERRPYNTLRGIVHTPPTYHRPLLAAYPRVFHLDSDHAECGEVSLSTPIVDHPTDFIYIYA